MSTHTSFLRLPSRSALLAIAVGVGAACGGVVVEPVGGYADPNAPGSEAGAAVDGETPDTPKPIAPIEPYVASVATTDVSILYPLPDLGQLASMIKPTESGVHGQLFSQATYTVVTNDAGLDTFNNSEPSGYANLALISLRLEPCSARRGASTCKSEVRAIFQPVYERTAGKQSPDGDTTLGVAALDGAAHVHYDLDSDELVVMMKQILTLKAAQGGLDSQKLGPHPILAAQGLSGGFATGLRGILLEHLGDSRIGRVTVFDHNSHPDSDGWNFTIHDKVGGALTAVNIPTLSVPSQLAAGSPAVAGPIATTFGQGGTAGLPSTDTIFPLVAIDRSTFSTTALQSAFDHAARIQNPQMTTVEATHCLACHFAEGAQIIGRSEYGFSSDNTFNHARNHEYESARTSVTNLHAFGYLHRKVSIMQRTANESVLVAEAMEAKVK